MKRGHTACSRRKKLRLERLEPRHLLAAAPIISEFLASNSDVLLDGNGNSSDWIEIYNQGDQVAQLEDYYLTDNSRNLTKWQFPAGTTLEPNAYLVVFASGDGVVDLTDNLHTGFKLSAGGEYVALVHSVGTSVVSEFGTNGADFPPQFNDVSYGHGSNASTGFFFTPTPNAANGPATPSYSDQVVVFSRPAGMFSDSIFQLTLSTGASEGSIVYTLDGSEPDANSPVFTSLLSITSTTYVRARFVTPSSELGPVFGASYTKLSTSTEDRTSNLPIVVLDSFGGGTVGNDYSDFIFSLFDVDGNSGLSSLQNEPEVSTLSGLHIRGNSSAGFAKKQYRLELHDQGRNDEDFSLAGLPEESDWVLFGPYVDKSLIRNPLAFELGRELGLEAPRTRFVEVYLNQGDSPSALTETDYLGVYTIRENIKIGENRVNIAELDGADVAEPDITGGYLLRFDPDLPAEDIILDTGGPTDLGLVDSEDYSATQRSWITDHINEFVSVLEGPNFTDSIDGYAKYIDVDSFLNLLVINELFRDQDSYFRSNYFYKDRGGKLTQGPLWDYNLTLGVGCCRNNTDIEGWQYQENGQRYATQWILRLLEDPNFDLAFRDRWQAVRESAFTLENIYQHIDTFVSQIGASADRNFQRWDILDNPNLPFDPPATDTYSEQITLMKQWILDRITWIDSQLLTPPTPLVTPSGSLQPQGTPITLTAPSVVVDTTVVSAGSPAAAWVPTDDSLETGSGPRWYDLAFDTTGWVTGTNGVGYEDSAAEYAGLIGTDVTAPWDALSSAGPFFESSVYSRFPFQLNASFDASSVTNALLRLKFDDGFVAYLNGQPIESARAPSNVSWQSNATSQRGDSAVIADFEVFDITNFSHQLRPGDNVLAIQVLNFNDTSSDLLIQPELQLSVATTTPPIYYTLDGSDPRGADDQPYGTLYTAPIPLEGAIELAARTRIDGQWSALTSTRLDAVVADFDADGDVDGADFLTWQRGVGLPSVGFSEGDANLDGQVDALDLAFWSGTIGLIGSPLSEQELNNEAQLQGMAAATSFFDSLVDLSSQNREILTKLDPTNVEQNLDRATAGRSLEGAANLAFDQEPTESSSTRRAAHDKLQPAALWLEDELLDSLISEHFLNAGRSDSTHR